MARPCSVRNFVWCLSLLFALLISAERAQGQAIQRPADERLELPEFEPPPEEEPILPPIVQPPEPEEAPSSGPGVFVEGYRIVGSTVFSTTMVRRFSFMGPPRFMWIRIET